MTFEIIGSGSSGNALVLNESILLDAGLPYKKIGPFVKPLKMVFISHCHG